MFIGLFFKNPIVPAAAIFLWEGINPFLPALLKKISVIFYLESMLPVTIDAGPFAVIPAHPSGLAPGCHLWHCRHGLHNSGHLSAAHGP